jgi:hypothetical protein
MAASPETGTCSSCRSTVRFVADGRGGTTCPVCGAPRKASEEVSDAGPRSRTGRRVVDVDSGGSHPRKGAPTRTPPRASAAGRRDSGPSRPVTGALDGTGAGRVGLSSEPHGARVPAVTGAATGASRWHELTDGVQARDGRPWRESSRYEPGDILLHTRHGMGVVERVGEDGALDVLFRAGYQRLTSTARAHTADSVPSP